MDNNIFRFKSSMNSKSAVLFSCWTLLVYFVGAFFGWSVPDDDFLKIKEYAIMLEVENSKLNKKLNSCKTK